MTSIMNLLNSLGAITGDRAVDVSDISKYIGLNENEVKELLTSLQ